MTRLLFASAALLALAGCSTTRSDDRTSVAQAASSTSNVAGEWNGKLVTPQRTLLLGVTLAQDAPGQFSGAIGSHDTGVWGRKLVDIVMREDRLSFTVPDSSGKFLGEWDGAAQAWSGAYTTPAGTFPLTLARGAVPPLPTVAGLDGRWEGALDVQGMVLKMVLRTRTDQHGTTTLMDSPSQGANGIPTANLARSGERVSFDAPSIRGRYEGALSSDGARLSGSWSQGGQSFPLDLAHVSASAELPKTNRPQTPKPPFPYKAEEVSYDNPKAPGVQLGCTLTTPLTGAPHPAAILITGSGAQDRNETLMDHQVFGVLADHLTRRGIAVLRCDDRGVGKSSGVFVNSMPKDFATDVEAGLSFLRTRADVDPKRIGLIGHSEGSITGPLAVNDDPDVAYLVLMGGLGAKGIDVMTEQRTLIALAMGAPAAQEPLIRMASRAVFTAAVNAPDDAAAQKDVAAMLVTSSGGGMTQDIADEAAKEIASAYMRNLLSYDPAPVLSKIAIPVLAITGGKDLQVPAKQNLPLIKSLLAGNADVTTIEVPSLNHLFQTARTGSPSEYAEIEETFAPAALADISGWIVERMKP